MKEAILISWNSPEGRKRLFESKYAQAFYSLAHLFERQMHPTYCGIASAVMVLNALRIGKKGLKVQRKLDVKIPDAMGGGTIAYNAYTQATFLGDTAKVKKRKEIEGRCDAFNPGLSLADLASKLRLHLCDARVVAVKEGSDKSIESFRKDLMAYMNERNSYLVANFHSAPLGREGGGHFSPIAAYHPPTDSCLVMDVAGHKQPWFWVEVPKFHAAMCTQDAKDWRGYVIVSDRLE